MKRLVTHIRPHIDDICAIWLFKRYHPEFKDAEIGFIPTNAKGGETVDDPDITYVGVGRGRFDEHKGDLEDCSASLVYAYLRNEVSIPQRDQDALERLIAWVLQEDMGKLSALNLREFSIPSVLQGYYKAMKRDSRASAGLGLMVLDGVFDSLKEYVQIERDWEARREFPSRFGKVVAIESNARDIDSYAYRRGFDLVAYINLQRDYYNIRARADAKIDLTPVYERLKEIEPQAGWYLHHSKHMLICGGDLEPGAVMSKRSLDDLVELLT